jgi:hypothetical protein
MRHSASCQVASQHRLLRVWVSREDRPGVYPRFARVDQTVALLPVVDGLHVMAVKVAQKHAVVARVVLGPLTRRMQHFCPHCHSGVVDRVDSVAVGGAEGQVQFPALPPIALRSEALR